MNSEITFIDTHAHLCDKRLNANEIVNSMKKDGLEKIITVSYDMASSHTTTRICSNNSNVYGSVGVHPSDVKFLKEEDLETLLKLSKNPKIVAIGEIGLDYHYEDTDRENQKYWLTRQLEVVEKSGLPTIIHLRDAYEDMQKIIKNNLDRFPAPAVLHCYSGSKETAQYYLSLGFYISFTGVITFKNATRYEEIIRSIPKDRLLIETDCPYLAPVPFRGTTNYPAYVKFVAQKIAEILNMPLEEVAQITKENTYRLFGKMNK